MQTEFTESFEVGAQEYLRVHGALALDERELFASVLKAVTRNYAQLVIRAEQGARVDVRGYVTPRQYWGIFSLTLQRTQRFVIEVLTPYLRFFDFLVRQARDVGA